MNRLQRQILQALCPGRISVYELIDHQDSSLKEFIEQLHKLQSQGLILMDQGKVELTSSGKNLTEQYGLKKIKNYYCNKCQATGIEIHQAFQHSLNLFEDIVSKRPEANKIYDQGFINPEGVMKRVAFLHERGDLYGKIFVVGDDDFFSIAASLTGIPEQIVAVDVDQRIVRLINETAQKHNLPITAMVYDVQEDIPKDLAGQFDSFLTDPVETLPGLELFLSRGVSSLKGSGCSGYFGLTTLEASLQKWYNLQKKILEMGFVLTDILRKFNTYPGAENNFFHFQDDLPIVQTLGARIDYNWYKSSFIRIESVHQPQPLIMGNRKLDERIYKDEESLATPF